MKLWDEEFYSKKLIFKYLKIICGVGLLMTLTKGIAFVALVPLSLMALSRRNAQMLFYCVLLSTVSLVTNGRLVDKGMTYDVTQRGLMILLGICTLSQIFSQRASPYLKPLLGLLAYVFYMACVSCQGYSPIISYLKLFLFTMAFLACYATANTLSNSPRLDIRNLRSMMLTLGVIFLIGSVLVMPFPGISAMIPKDVEEAATLVSLYRGMTNHSQELGPVVTLLGLFLLADLFFSIQKKNKLYTILLLTVPLLIYKTSSRTAMGALLAGVCFLCYCLTISRGVKRSWKSKVINGALMGGIVLSIAVAAVPSTRKAAVKFVVKYGEDGTPVSSEQAFSSRQSKWNQTLECWRMSPYIGNGFQVSYNMWGFKPKSFADIVSAPVEKCTWTYAVLEEGGVFGMIIFCAFILFAFATMMRLRAYIGATLFLTMLILNLGELSMFAMSGMGGFMWVLVMTGLVFDRARNKKKPLPTPETIVSEQDAPSESAQPEPKPKGLGPKLSIFRNARLSHR